MHLYLQRYHTGNIKLLLALGSFNWKEHITLYSYLLENNDIYETILHSLNKYLLISYYVPYTRGSIVIYWTKILMLTELEV